MWYSYSVGKFGGLLVYEESKITFLFLAAAAVLAVFLSSFSNEV